MTGRPLHEKVWCRIGERGEIEIAEDRFVEFRMSTPPDGHGWELLYDPDAALASPNRNGKGQGASTLSAVGKLRQARADQALAEKSTRLAFAEAFPVGGPISWKKGHHVQIGKVISHLDWTECIRVENSRTGIRLNIRFYDVMAAFPPETTKTKEFSNE